MKYMRTAGYTRTDYETNTQIAEELNVTPILDKLLEYKRNWIKHVNGMPRNILPRVMKQYIMNSTVYTRSQILWRTSKLEDYNGRFI
jgi:hypothetical protein